MCFFLLELTYDTCVGLDSTEKFSLILSSCGDKVCGVQTAFGEGTSVDVGDEQIAGDRVGDPSGLIDGLKTTKGAGYFTGELF